MRIYTCTVCGHTRTETIPALVLPVVPPVTPKPVEDVQPSGPVETEPSQEPDEDN